jgi:general secretion pathway protein H
MDKQRRKDSGVTLIEVLVVLALIGVSAGIVTYALPSGGQTRTLDQEATLLAARLNLAAERSLIGGDHYRLDWTAAGYTFATWREGAWDEARSAPLDQEHRFARGAVLSGAGGAQQGTLRITPDMLPASDGARSLRLEVGALRQVVLFDGATARVAP